MPAYDYRCASCEQVFEVTRSVGETREECCPTCGAAAKRVFTPVGVVFKGSGFHNTDYRPRPAEDKPASGSACSTKSESSACKSCPASGDK